MSNEEQVPETPTAPQPDPLPFTMFGVPIADVFTEWHRRWTEEPEAYYSEAESLAQPDDDYGRGAARYFTKIAHEMSPWTPEGVNGGRCPHS